LAKDPMHQRRAVRRSRPIGYSEARPCAPWAGRPTAAEGLSGCCRGFSQTEKSPCTRRASGPSPRAAEVSALRRCGEATSCARTGRRCQTRSTRRCVASDRTPCTRTDRCCRRRSARRRVTSTRTPCTRTQRSRPHRSAPWLGMHDGIEDVTPGVAPSPWLPGVTRRGCGAVSTPSPSPNNARDLERRPVLLVLISNAT
jgi:hypothetical protein